jgi:hypothetical protein
MHEAGVSRKKSGSQAKIRRRMIFATVFFLFATATLAPHDVDSPPLRSAIRRALAVAAG